MSLPITALILGVLAAIFLVPVTIWYVRDRNEQRQAEWEWGRIWPARRFQVALPYLAEGSYHRAAPRMIRSGPLYPADLPGPVAHPQAQSPAEAGESSVAVPVSRERVLTATVRATPRLEARTWPEAAQPTPPPPATRYAPTADEIRATLHARVIKALGGVDANGWDTVVTRIYEDAAAKVYTGERM